MNDKNNIWCGTWVTQHTRLMLLTFKCTVLFVCLFYIQQATFNRTFTGGHLQAIPLSFTLAILQCITCSHASGGEKRLKFEHSLIIIEIPWEFLEPDKTGLSQTQPDPNSLSKLLIFCFNKLGSIKTHLRFQMRSLVLEILALVFQTTGDLFILNMFKLFCHCIVLIDKTMA